MKQIETQAKETEEKVAAEAKTEVEQVIVRHVVASSKG